MSITTLYQFLNKRPVTHVLFWLMFVIIGSLVFSYQQNFPYSFFLINFLVHLPVFVLFTYGVIYYLVPYFLERKNTVVFFGALLASVCLATLVRILVSRYIYYAFFIPKVLHPRVWLSVDTFLINVVWIIGPAIVFATFKYYKSWMRSRDLANEAERKQLSSELQALKAQLNPHFLFNTFNNLYVLALQKSDKTPAIISKMSDLFHYILYECNPVEVPVSKEIKLVNDYIELEMLRYSDRLSVQLTSDIDSDDYLIPPMMLYTFVENCFKHGCADDPGSPWIKLHVKVADGLFEFHASNSIPKKNCVSGETSGGVGLSNIKRRLELIYPENHVLQIRKEACEFFVDLKIQKKNQQ